MRFNKYIEQEFSLVPSSSSTFYSWLPFLTCGLSLIGLSPLAIALLLPDGTIIARVPLWTYGICILAAFLLGLYTEKVKASAMLYKTIWLNNIGVVVSIGGMVLYLYGLPLLLATYH